MTLGYWDIRGVRRGRPGGGAAAQGPGRAERRGRGSGRGCSCWSRCLSLSRGPARARGDRGLWVSGGGSRRADKVRNRGPSTSDLGPPSQLAHAIRLLLEYTDSSYEEKMYTMGDAPDYDRSQWLNEKFKLGLDFPNLPYLIDGAHKITQSNAILRYIARKHNLCGETEEEKIRVDILVNQAMDVSNQLATVCYSPDFGLKEISAYMKSGRFLRTPLFGKMALWGNK
uniref:glutathione transferase n=1 Tax=Prolemur simus TaxID=1328070 RepID=A0A8C8ZLB1_PROSS